jgi:hypothetical protein
LLPVWSMALVVWVCVFEDELSPAPGASEVPPEPLALGLASAALGIASAGAPAISAATT